MNTVSFVRVLSVILAVGFIAINIAIPLPHFIVIENIMLSVLLICGAILTMSKRNLGLSILAISSLYYSGRISRSVITTMGTLAPLWETHAPVFIVLIILGVMSIAMLSKR
jgi:predicted membrane metal-binding protein